MIKNIVRRFSKPLSLEYANSYLRSKGIATSLRGENNLTFKLYDMNWSLYYEKGRLGFRNSFTLDKDSNMYCMLQAANKLNDERWIVKAFVDTYTPEEGDKESETEESVSSIIFSFEGFCHSEADFRETYEFAVYAITDGIEFHRKCYAELLNSFKSVKNLNPIGFHAERNLQVERPSAQSDRQHNRIGFVQYHC